MANIVVVKRPIKQWITVNGKHIPIYADVSSDERKKDSQIEANRKEGNRLNTNQTLPKRLFLPDIPAETANRTSDILNLRTKQRYRFKDGTSLTNVYVFAGYGCSKEFRDAEKYARRYGGKASEWQHCAGMGFITDGKKTLEREIHWVQGKDGKMHEAFIKFRE